MENYLINVEVMYMYHVPNIVECRHYQKVGGGEATCPRTRTVHPGQCFISDNTRR